MSKTKTQTLAVLGAAAALSVPTSALANVDVEELFAAHERGDRDAAAQAIQACCGPEESAVAVGITERVFNDSEGDLNTFALILAGEKPMKAPLTDREAAALAAVDISDGRTWEGNGGRTWEGNGGRTWEGTA